MAEEDLVLHASLRGELSQDLRGVRRELDRTGDAARRASRTGVADLHRNLLGLSRTAGTTFATGMKRGATALGVLTGAAGVFGLKAAGQFQASRIAFDTLLGSVEKGGRLFGDLQKLNLKTPFEFGEVTRSAQTLLSYGVPLEQLMGSLTGLVDVASLTGKGADGLNRLSLAFGQVVSTGRLQGDEARQFAEAGINVYEIYAKKMGISQAEVRKLGEAGKLSSDILIAAFADMEGPLAKFQGGAEKANKTLFGQLSNFKDQLSVRLADAADPLVDSLTTSMPQIIDLVGGFVDQIGPPVFDLLGDLAGAATQLLPIVGPILSGLIGGVGQLLDAALPGLEALRPLGVEISDSIGSLVDELLPVMPELVDLFVALVGIAPDFIDLLADIVPLVAPVARMATALLNFGPVDDIMAGLLATLLGYRALTGIVSTLHAFAGGLTAITAAGGLGPIAGGGKGKGKGRLGGGGLAGKAAGGGALAGPLGIVAAFLGVKDLQAIGTIVNSEKDFDLGNLLEFSEYDDTFKALFGDPAVPAGLRAAHAGANVGPGASHRRITSGLRGWGIRGSGSGHARGTAIDVAGPGLASYIQNVRKSGGWAVQEGSHAHAQWGDPAGAQGGAGAAGGWWMPSITVQVLGPINGQVDFERGSRVAFRRAMEDLERERRERAYAPIRGGA